MEKRFVLMLEDDPDDHLITDATLKELELPIHIEFVKSSEALIRHLKHGEKPLLILLDFNSLPLNALDVLKVLKADKEYSSIPVVVLGDSTASRYVSDCYRNGASTFIQKPSSMTGTKTKIETFFNYWLHVASV